MTRTDALIRDITERLQERRVEIDRGVRTVIVTAHFSPECLEPRELTDMIVRERRPDPKRSTAGR